MTTDSETQARQLFAPGADAIMRFVLFGGFAALVLLLLVVGGVAQSTYVSGVAVAPEQPAPFSHKHHSGELGLDCRNCHQQAEYASTAGLPPTWTCMTCHSQIWTGSPMLAPVRDSLAQDKPLEWTRVNRLPDYVYFNHSIHVTKGFGCSTCHGAVDAMQLTYRANSFQMQWCLNCHQHPEKYIRPTDEVWDMRWTPGPDQDAVGRQLVLERRIRPGAELRDCSTCHR